MLYDEHCFATERTSEVLGQFPICVRWVRVTGLALIRWSLKVRSRCHHFRVC
jgi:hypothetical protein